MTDFFRTTFHELKAWLQNGAHISDMGGPAQGSTPVLMTDRPAMTSRLTWQDILSDAAEEIVKKARASTVAMDETLQYTVTKVELLIPQGLHSEGKALLSGPEKYLTKNFKTYLHAKDGDFLINADQLMQLVVRLVDAPDAVVPLASGGVGESEHEELVTYNNPRLPNTLHNRLTIVLAARVDTNPAGKTRGQLQAELARSKGNVSVAPRCNGTHDLAIEVEGVVKIIDLFPATVGKGEDCDLRLANEHVSRKHLIIDLDEDSRPRITQKATNNTFLNGRELRLDEKAMLGDSGVIELVHLAEQGGVRLTYRAQVRGGTTSAATLVSGPASARSALTQPAVPRATRSATVQPAGAPAAGHAAHTAQPSDLGTGVTKIAQPGITSRRSPLPYQSPTGQQSVAPGEQELPATGVLALKILSSQGALLQTLPLARLPLHVSIGGASLEFLDGGGNDALMVDVLNGGVLLLDASSKPGRTVGKQGAAMHRWAANQSVCLPDGSTATLCRA